MICGMEIGMAIVGLLALIRGRMTISKTRVVVGVPARLLGIVALTPLPVAFGAVILFSLVQGAAVNPEKFAEDNRVTLVLIEAGIVIGIAIFVFAVGALVAIHPDEAARRERADRYDDYEEEDEGDRRDRDRDEYDRRDRDRDRDEYDRRDRDRDRDEYDRRDRDDDDRRSNYR